MTKYVECRVIDSKPTDRPRRVVEVAAVTRRKKTEKPGVPKFVTELYLHLESDGPRLNAVV